MRPLWRDRWSLCLAALGLLLNAALVAYLWSRVPHLPDLLPVHFNVYGVVDLVGVKRELLRLPMVGAIMWTTNFVLALIVTTFDRVLARLLLGVALIVQLLFGIAALHLIA